MPIRPALLALLAALLSPASALAASAPVTETASGGAVQASLTYTKVSDFEFRGLDLTIARDGQSAFQGPVHVRDCEQPYCKPAGADSGSGSIGVADLDADGEPEVLVDLYTGGAHCCSVTEVLRWTGSAYEASARNWGDPGYTLDPAAGGQPATFATFDDRFAYAFAAYAYSAMPVRLLQYRAGSWRDVTREHLDAVGSDAARLGADYRKLRRGHYALGILAAWVADEYRLGRRAQADRFVAAELRAGRLRGFAPWPQRAAFVRSLHRRLRAWGYAG